MNGKALSHDKGCLLKSDNNSNSNEQKVIAKVSQCLTPKHSQCSGPYHDCLTGSYLVSCRCNCHSTKQ